MSRYRIIDCDVHDLYEIAALRRQRLLLNWRDADGVDHLELVRARNLETVPDGEFLLAELADGTPVRIRLDWIHHARDPASGQAFPAGH